jgi:hypothetical protein
VLCTNTISLPRLYGFHDKSFFAFFVCFLECFSLMCVCVCMCVFYILCAHLFSISVCIFLHFLLSGEDCVVDLSDIDNIGDN